MDSSETVADQYRQFAAEARDSPCFERWALALADDAEVLAWVASLPSGKQQPNLVFAAARWHGVQAPGPYSGLRGALLEDNGDVRATIMSRSTQTNEVGRLACLMPVFAQISSRARQPLALVEAGASAGLCLFPDRYDYHWSSRGRLTGSGGATLECVVDGPVPVPASHPVISWRSGIDVNPLDVADEDAVRWLANLVWPEQERRRRRLLTAIDVARKTPPQVTRGDLLEKLPEQVDIARKYGEVVVFHSAVIAYLDLEERAIFQAMMLRLVNDGACHWVSNESKRVLPDIASSGPTIPNELSTFVLGLDGQAVAWTHGHGTSMKWVQADSRVG